MKRVIDIEVEATVEELASAFCALDSREQARFFECVAEVAEQWEGGMGADMQWYDVGCKVREKRAKGENDAAEVLQQMAAPLFLHTLCRWYPSFYVR